MQAIPISLNDLESRTLERELKEIPVYPGAEEVKTWVPDADTIQLVSIAFVTSNNEEEVYSFYKDALGGNGWVQDFANSWRSRYKWTWEDKSGDVPWGQSLDLKIISSATPTGKRTYVVLDLIRFPVSVPLYPDAGQISSKIVHENCEHRETSISYVTIATGKEIEAYYKSVLVESGWTYDEVGAKRIGATPDMFFRADDLTTLSVSTHPKSQGFTEVVLNIGEFVLGDI